MSLGCVCFGSQEKVKRACPEFIQASELRFPRQPPLSPPPHSFGRLLHQTEDRLCLQRSAIVREEKKDEFTLQPVLCAPPCVVSLDGFQCKCQEKHKERSVAIKVLIFFLFKWLYKREE